MTDVSAEVQASAWRAWLLFCARPCRNGGTVCSTDYGSAMIMNDQMKNRLYIIKNNRRMATWMILEMYHNSKAQKGRKGFRFCLAEGCSSCRRVCRRHAQQSRSLRLQPGPGRTERLAQYAQTMVKSTMIRFKSRQENLLEYGTQGSRAFS